MRGALPNYENLTKHPPQKEIAIAYGRANPLTLHSEIPLAGRKIGLAGKSSPPYL